MYIETEPTMTDRQTALFNSARFYEGTRRVNALAAMTYDELYYFFHQHSRTGTNLDRAVRDELHKRAYA